MITRFTSVMAGVLSTSLVALGVIGLSAAGAAGTTPSYYPDAGSIGTVTLYNAAGSQITSGSLSDSPLATYYKSSGPKTGGTHRGLPLLRPPDNHSHRRPAAFD